MKKIFYLWAALSCWTSVGLANQLVVTEYDANYAFSPENSQKLYSFLKSGLEQNLSSFWVERVQQAQVNESKTCGMKATKRFNGSNVIEYVCKIPGSKYFGKQAKEDFENNLHKLNAKVETIHGKNIGCTRFENVETSKTTYLCRMTIFDTGTTESDAPWIFF